MTTVDTRKIGELMAARGLDVSGLARAAGLSRQGVYRFLRPGYRPFSDGFSAVAEALGVTPASLLDAGEGEQRLAPILDLLERAAAGEPRAFEVLPAALSGLPARALGELDEPSDPLHHRLLAAAGELSNGIRPTRKMHAFAQRQAARCEPGRAFFFSSRWMDAGRIAATTPAEMRKHLVFGAFDRRDFERHFA
jgi:transcriptional regulator with XRE-family HTH domain